jgi:hypothetical protein
VLELRTLVSYTFFEKSVTHSEFNLALLYYYHKSIPKFEQQFLKLGIHSSNTMNVEGFAGTCSNDLEIIKEYLVVMSSS